MSLSKQISNFV